MQIDSGKIDTLRQRENARFEQDRPRSMALLSRARASMPAGVPMNWMVTLYEHPPMFVREAHGAYITDVDGYRYLDMNLSDTSMACGYGVESVARAVNDQFLRGSQTTFNNGRRRRVRPHYVEDYRLCFVTSHELPEKFASSKLYAGQTCFP